VKINKNGLDRKKGTTLFRYGMDSENLTHIYLKAFNRVKLVASRFYGYLRSTTKPPVPTIEATEKPRTILIATMEYEIEDWNIKIKIGGLGAMAQCLLPNLNSNTKTDFAQANGESLGTPEPDMGRALCRRDRVS
jgi:alpha-1,3-glucan synthase